MKYMKSIRPLLLTSILLLALFLSACGTDETPPEVQVDDTSLTTTADSVPTVEMTGTIEADGTVEADNATAEPDAENTETVVDSQLITDTEVLTTTEVITSATVTEVITETNVMTDVVTNDVVDSEVMTETTDLGTETSPVRTQGADSDATGYMIQIYEDETGRQTLTDMDNRPIFTYDGDGMLDDENFVPIQVDDDVTVGEGVDPDLFNVEERDGVRQLTYNERPLYRFIGEVESELESLARDLGLSRLNPMGEPEAYE